MNHLEPFEGRVTSFHVNPVCSPTRAALLTGRDHHTVGMRSVSNFSTGYPNMRGHVTNHAAAVAEVLRDAGSTTFGLGKWHLCQMEDTSAAGPYDQWPCQRGYPQARARETRRGRVVSQRRRRDRPGPGTRPRPAARSSW